MTRPVVIVGCGGFGREVWLILRALRMAGEFFEVEGFVDDAPSAADLSRVRALGSVVLGSVAELATRRQAYSAVVAVGSPVARRRICTALAASPVDYPRLVHPQSTVGEPHLLGLGAVIAPGARLSTNIQLGEQVHIDQNATIGHDTTIGAFVRINPQACISGSVVLGEGVLVGANATVLQGLRVGEHATVGAGSCVVRDVPAHATVKGVPAR